MSPNHKAWPDETGGMAKLSVWVPKRIKDKLVAKAKRDGTSISKELTKLLLKVDKFL
jgi:hypothetical protein